MSRVSAPGFVRRGLTSTRSFNTFLYSSIKALFSTLFSRTRPKCSGCRVWKFGCWQQLVGCGVKLSPVQELSGALENRIPIDAEAYAARASATCEKGSGPPKEHTR